MSNVPDKVRSLKQGNKFYPLPHDYPALTGEGQRQARVDACRMQQTPEELVHAWAFFRDYYLRSLPEGVWYQPPYAPSPPPHYQFIYDVGMYPRNVYACPRGFGKSKKLKELLLLFSQTRDHFRIVLVKASDEFVKDDFSEIMWQLENNERMIADFGSLRPRRGTAGSAWSGHKINLTNGFQMVGRSVMGKLLGLRPDLYVFDDAEFDPAMRVSPTILTEQMKYLYYNHVRPAMRQGTSVLLVGTLLTRRSFLYYMARTKEVDDKRVGFFNRVVHAVRRPDGGLLWPEYWTEAILREMEEEMGSASFAAQMMNNPGTESDRVLRIDPHLGMYEITQPDSLLESDPLSSQATLVSRSRLTRKPTGEQMDKRGLMNSVEAQFVRQIERPLGPAVSGMYRILVADPIRKPSSTSDYACCMVVGIERGKVYKDTWWVLDMRIGRVKEEVFINWIWDLGCKWRVKVVGIESASIQKHLVERTRDDFAERSVETGWMPRVLPVKYTPDPARKFAAVEGGKPARICQLAWRFEQSRIKFPGHLMGKPPFSMLRQQIEDTTEDLKLLQYDDAIDTLAMVPFVVKPAGKFNPETVQDNGVMALLAKGERYFPGTKSPLVAAVNASELTPEALAGMESRRAKEPRKRPRHRRRRYSVARSV